LKLAGLCAIPAATTTWHLQEFSRPPFRSQKPFLNCGSKLISNKKLKDFLKVQFMHQNANFKGVPCQKRGFFGDLLPAHADDFFAEKLENSRNLRLDEMHVWMPRNRWGGCVPQKPSRKS